jgi:hypothetical protein
VVSLPGQSRIEADGRPASDGPPDELNEGTPHSAIYLLRTVQQHHVQLVGLADRKANFLLGASFIVLSLLAGRLAAGQPSWAELAFGGFVSIAAFFSVLVLAPAVSGSKSSRSSLPSNSFFFGYFGRTDFETFKQEATRTLQSDESVYDAMLIDIYCIGRVLLGTKYRYLRWSYGAFLAGLVVTPIVATIELFVLR